MLRRRFWVMALVVVLGCVASVWYALNQPRVYEAAAAVQIRGPVVEEVSGAGAAADDSRVAQQLELIERRIMARDNMAELVERYGLFTEPPNLSMMEKVGLMRGAIRLEELRGDRPEWMPGGNQPSGLIIWVQLGDPETAAIVANDLMGSVISQSRQGLIERARTTRAFFEEEERRLAEEIAALENRIADYHGAETFTGFFLTTPEAVRKLLPPPLEPFKHPLAVAFAFHRNIKHLFQVHLFIEDQLEDFNRFHLSEAC